MEAHPDSWYRRHNPRYHSDSLRALCQFIGANVQNTVFVENATTGIESVLSSITWSAGDAILLTNLTYHSTKVMAKRRASVAQLELIFPLDKSQILSKYKEALEGNPDIKLAVLDHISSPTSVVFPVAELAELCRNHDVMTLVDGAHVVGQLPLEVEELKVDFYTGNVHKWFFTPRGCAYLWVSPNYHDVIRPAVTSHFHGVALHYDFCVRGTKDDTPYHTIPEAIAFHNDLGGSENITAYNTGLLEEAVVSMEKAWGTNRLAVDGQLQAPFMRLILVPDVPNYEKTSVGGGDLETDLFHRFNIQTLCMPVQGQLYIRLSAHVYNTPRDFERLRDAILEIAKEPKQEKASKGYRLPIMHWDLSPLANLEQEVSN